MTQTKWTLPILECAFCFKKMKKFAMAGNGATSLLDKPPEIAPLVCDKCAEVNLMVRGRFCRKPTDEETKALESAPIAPFLRDLQAAYRLALTKGEVH